jgi:uncharacterized protein (DUF1697 family)
VKYAAFFRNLNLGRKNCPSKAQLEQAFLDAGAREASSFLTNGTLVFLEKLLGLPATTRSWNTVTRLVRKHA